MKRFPALAILYYGFTIIIGVILVFYFLSYGTTNKTSKALIKYAEDNKYFEMTQLLSVYQNEDAVLTQTLEDGTSFAIYEVDATYSKTVDDTTKYYVEKGYMGLITNPGSKWVRSEYEDSDGRTINNFGLSFTGLDKENNTINYEYRIGYVSGETYASDSEEATIKNRWYSYETCKFYYFMIGDVVFEENNFASVSSFSFVNADKSVAQTVTFDSPLTLTSDFFTKVSEFNTKYNQMIDDGTSNSDINSYVDEYNNTMTSAGYSMTSYQTLVKYVPLQNALKIIGYFLIILVIGDFLVGKHHIIHLFQRLFGKGAKASKDIPDYMDSYDVNVVFKAIVPNGYNKIINIKYVSEAGDSKNFELKPSNNFEAEDRIKNGIYQNPTFDCEGLKCIDIPSSINIKGFKYYQEFKFEEKKEENSKESE